MTRSSLDVAAAQRVLRQLVLRKGLLAQISRVKAKLGRRANPTTHPVRQLLVVQPSHATPNIGGCADSFFGRSATIASAVIKTCDRGGTLSALRTTLGWIDDDLSRKIAVLSRLRVVAFENLANHDRRS
jgi:hypothetical protein